jgi:hypothetical protein
VKETPTAKVYQEWTLTIGLSALTLRDIRDFFGALTDSPVNPVLDEFHRERGFFNAKHALEAFFDVSRYVLRLGFLLNVRGSDGV